MIKVHVIFYRLPSCFSTDGINKINTLLRLNLNLSQWRLTYYRTSRLTVNLSDCCPSVTGRNILAQLLATQNKQYISYLSMKLGVAMILLPGFKDIEIATTGFPLVS